MPFLDALSAGWILPLAATVRLEISDGGRTVNAGWEFDRVMVSTHAPFQAAGNPFEPRPPMKFHNHWTIRTPPGWSCLFLPPVNRRNDVVELFGGLVDTDTYTAPVNLPFVATGPDGVHVLPKDPWRRWSRSAGTRTSPRRSARRPATNGRRAAAYTAARRRVTGGTGAMARAAR